MLYLPDMNNISTQPDLLKKPNDTVTMEKVKSQITFFLLKQNGELAIVAIQTDCKKGEIFQIWHFY